jgi:hypothetical protein
MATQRENGFSLSRRCQRPTRRDATRIEKEIKMAIVKTRRLFNVDAEWIAANGKRRSALYIVSEPSEVGAVRTARELLRLDEGSIRSATFRTIAAR